MKTVRLPLWLVLGAHVLSGCVVVAPHSHAHKKGHVASSRPECHPSQYWDGEKCRHKGKGRGARKHDD